MYYYQRAEFCSIQYRFFFHLPTAVLFRDGDGEVLHIEAHGDSAVNQ